MLPDFRLETFFSTWEFRAEYNLCASDMESMSLSELLEMASSEQRQEWDKLHLGYTTTFGAPALRRAIANTYDRIEPDDILTFAGAEEGIFAAMQVLLSADDHAIVITPNYQAVETVPASICEVSGVALDPDDDWNLDIDKVREALRPNTRLISINFPHNPTGKIISADILEDLVSMARQRGIYLFSDEVYRLIERDTSKRIPQVADIYERGLSLNVMSKAYGLPGLRIGWIATQDKELLGKLERAKHYLSICNSGPSEMLATIALGAANKILRRNRDIVASNLNVMDSFFDDHAHLFEWRIPDGGCIGFPRFLGEGGVESFCKKLVEDARVLLLPASVYQSALGPTPTDRFRIGFGRLNVAESLNVMRRFIAETNPNPG